MIDGHRRKNPSGSRARGPFLAPMHGQFLGVLAPENPARRLDGIFSLRNNGASDASSTPGNADDQALVQGAASFPIWSRPPKGPKEASEVRLTNDAGSFAHRAFQECPWRYQPSSLLHDGRASHSRPAEGNLFRLCRRSRESPRASCRWWSISTAGFFPPSIASCSCNTGASIRIRSPSTLGHAVVIPMPDGPERAHSHRSKRDV